MSEMARWEKYCTTDLARISTFGGRTGERPGGKEVGRSMSSEDCRCDSGAFRPHAC